mmetsp:Transcript_34648/g.99884  ORF Transcript_34648/g.99884 Transcript_34648/m.99884 type:complete len:208 (-) Transcript_34648:714-1337(-)
MDPASPSSARYTRPRQCPRGATSPASGLAVSRQASRRSSRASTQQGGERRTWKWTTRAMRLTPALSRRRWPASRTWPSMAAAGVRGRRGRLRTRSTFSGKARRTPRPRARRAAFPRTGARLRGRRTGRRVATAARRDQGRAPKSLLPRRACAASAGIAKTTTAATFGDGARPRTMTAPRAVAAWTCRPRRMRMSPETKGQPQKAEPP